VLHLQGCFRGWQGVLFVVEILDVHHMTCIHVMSPTRNQSNKTRDGDMKIGVRL